MVVWATLLVPCLEPALIVERLHARRLEMPVELIEIELSRMGRLSRSVELAHAETELDRGLIRDEVVVVKDREGAAYLALVRDVSRDENDLCYRLELGEKIPLPDHAVGEVSRRLADIDGRRVPRPRAEGAVAG